MDPAKNYDLPDIDLLSLNFDSFLYLIIRSGTTLIGNSFPLVLATDDTVLHTEVADQSNRVTKAQCRTFTEEIAHVFCVKYAIGTNGPSIDVVACISSGRVLLSSLFYGGIAAGGFIVLLAPASPPPRSRDSVKHDECSLEAARLRGVPLERVLILESRGGQRSLRDCWALANISKKHRGTLSREVIPDPVILRDRTACLIYSSGTTGKPEGVRISHRNLFSSARVFIFAYRDYIARQRLKDPNFKSEYRTAYLLQPALCGGTICWTAKFDPRSSSSTAKCTAQLFITVPPIYQLMVQSPLDESWNDGSISPLVPNIRLRIVDEEENDVEEGQGGVFIVQGPMASKQSFTVDGSGFKTGVLGLHRNGVLFIIDWKMINTNCIILRETIKHRGLQVAPAELGALLLSNPLVQDAAVIGIPDPKMEGNELPCAYVVADQNQVPERKIHDFVKRNLASGAALSLSIASQKAPPERS
ncbi:uncharacterized protein BDW43DRAFT_321262 [Aspergillus alliaceus]|uniref:uncharacterized protein n=1 Tax=Petromyces alliaceus TaxID=209559 RepID=UPI0012A61840|nr:uncharacterized protein BDW43DRAFT_321262 [Aspergillus alliaceus]KAB8238217.1 hypothetical protein BDW43DRAFT_321262 [Aspergillus alliaceus]